MIQQQVYVLNTFLMVFDALCIIISGYAAFYLRYYLTDRMWNMEAHIFTASVLILIFTNNYIMGRLGLYSDRRPISFLQMGINIVKSVIIDFGVLSVSIFMVGYIGYSKKYLVYFALFTFASITTYRIFFRYYISNFAQKRFHVRNILLIGCQDRLKIVSDILSRQLSWGHNIIGWLSVYDQDTTVDNFMGSIQELPNILKQYTVDEVIFALDANRGIPIDEHINLCRSMGIPIRILPALWKPEDRCIYIESCQNVPFLTIHTDNFNAAGLLYKRLLDLAGAMVGFTIFLLIYPVVAALIKWESKGPVIFKQKRMGRNGRVFELYKFRSMYADAEERKAELVHQNEMQGAIFKMKNDPRITRVGQFLRKTSVDEFPQFINVLKGEMSLVGTRPPTLEEVEKYQPQHLKRISAKPGLTGMWQVSGRNRITDFNQICELDCSYMNQWRFMDDIKILLKTIYIVLRRKGAL